MAAESNLELSAALWDALPVDLRTSASDDARRVITMAAYLDSLSLKYGMSEHHEDELIARAHEPTNLLPFVSHYLADETGAIEAEGLRDKLYRAITNPAGSARSQDSHQPEVVPTQLLTTAQVYWAISRDDETRPHLTFAAGTDVDGRNKRGEVTTYRALIWVDAKAVDVATLRRTPRSDLMRGIGQTSGQALRAKGAELAVLAAQRIIASKEQEPPSLAHTYFHSTPSKSGESRITSIGARPELLKSEGKVVNRARAKSGEAPLEHDRLRSLQQLGNEAQSVGSLNEAAVLFGALVSILQEQSASDLGDHETQLANARLQAGLTCVMAGRMQEALDYCISAERSSQLLWDLNPLELAHKVRVGSALALIGLIHFQSGQAGAASVALSDAVSVFQDLTDHSADHEDMLVVVLTMFGTVQLQSDQRVGAERDLARAVAISKKLAAHDNANHAFKVLLLLALTSLGSLYLVSDRMVAAEGPFSRAVEISNALPMDSRDDAVQALAAGALYSLGMLYIVADRTEDAEAALFEAVAIAQELISQNPDAPAGSRTPPAHSAMFGGALCLLGVVYLSTDRGEEAKRTLTHAVAVLKDAGEMQDDGFMLSLALESLEELNQQIEQEAGANGERATRADQLDSD